MRRRIDSHRDLGAQRDAAYDVRDYGADPSGAADSLPAFDLATAAVKASGRPGRIVIPKGDYLFSSSHAAGGITYQWSAVESDGVTISAPDGARILSSVASARVVFAYGSAKPSGFASWSTNEFRDATAYDLTGTIAKGSRTVTFAIGSEVSNFAAGDLVYLRSGQTIAAGTDTEPTGEINKVKSVSDPNLILAWPAAHAYAAENYNSGSSGISSVGGGGSAAPYKISKVTDRVLRNVRIENLSIEATGSVLQALSVWGVLGFRWTGGDLVVPKNGFGSRDVRDAECAGFRIERVDDGTRAYLFGPSTGCTHWNAHDFELLSDGDGYLHIHEDVAQSRFHHFRVSNANFDGTDPCIDVRARATDVEVTDWTVLVQNGSDANAVFVADTPSSGKLARGRIIAGNSTANVRIDVGDWEVEDVRTSNGRVGIRSLQADAGTRIGDRIEAVVTAARPTIAAGKLRRYEIVRRVDVEVLTQFSAAAAVKIGHATDDDAYLLSTAVDVAAGTVAEVAKRADTGAGAAFNRQETVADRDIAIAVTGSPAAGVARVSIQVGLAARSD